MKGFLIISGSMLLLAVLLTIPIVRWLERDVEIHLIKSGDCYNYSYDGRIDNTQCKTKEDALSFIRYSIQQDSIRKANKNKKWELVK